MNIDTDDNDPTETGAVLPAPCPTATFDELQAMYEEVDRSDAPEFLKQRVLFDLSDRIRDYDKPPVGPAGAGRSLTGLTAEQIHGSGFKGKVWVDGKFVKA